MRYKGTARLLGALIFSLSLAACGGGGDDSAPAPSPAIYSVTYSVTSGFPVDVTYTTSSGTEQRTVTSGTFTHTFMGKAGDFLYVSGQTNGTVISASVTAKITVNGQNFKTATSLGAFSIATASGGCC